MGQQPIAMSNPRRRIPKGEDIIIYEPELGMEPSDVYNETPYFAEPSFPVIGYNTLPVS
jgi:hypothetical protein